MKITYESKDYCIDVCSFMKINFNILNYHNLNFGKINLNND